MTDKTPRTGLIWESDRFEAAITRSFHSPRPQDAESYTESRKNFQRVIRASARNICIECTSRAFNSGTPEVAHRV